MHFSIEVAVSGLVTCMFCLFSGSFGAIVRNNYKSQRWSISVFQAQDIGHALCHKHIHIKLDSGELSDKMM